MDSAATSLKKARPTGELHCSTCRKMKFPKRHILTRLLGEFSNMVAGVCPKCGRIMHSAIDATFHERLPTRMREKLRIRRWTLETYTQKYAHHQERMKQRKLLRNVRNTVLPSDTTDASHAMQEGIK
jgi:hypothetical protein